MRLAEGPPQSRQRRLSRFPRPRFAPGGHLSPPLHRRWFHLLALSEGRRGRGVPLSRQSQDREAGGEPWRHRSEEHTSELQSLMRISYAVFCLNKKKQTN